MRRIITTYAIVTPSSAAAGEVADQGWEDKDGVAFEDVDEAISWLLRKGVYASGSHFHPRTWYSTEPEPNYRTGGEKTYSFHLKGFSEDEQRRIFNAITRRSNPVKRRKHRKLRRVARRGGRTMTVTTSSRVVKTTRMNPRGLSLEPYRRNFRFGRDRHFENIDHSPSSKNIRNMMRVLFPRWTKEQHVERLIALSRLIHVAGGVWGRIADKAHAEAFPGKRRGFADYKVSGVGRDEYPERLKGRLRVAARAESTITRAIHAHAMLAGKAALRRAGITEAAMSSYRNNPGGDRFKKTAEFISDDGTHSFRAGKNLDAGTWDDRLYVDTGTGFKHKPEFGYDGHDSAADAAAAAKANRDWHDGKRSTRPNPHDSRTAATQRIPLIRATIPAGGGKDPRTAETRRLRVVTSAHRKNPVRTLAVPRTMWNHLKRADKRVKHGHRYVRCKTRRARRAFWLPCTVR